MPIWTGDALRAMWEAPPSPPVAIIEEFLYEGQVMLLSAAPGTGKSILSTQMALSLSSGNAVFGSLAVPKPRRVYYLQLEGSSSSTCGRMQRQCAVIKGDAQNIWWDYRHSLNLLDARQLDSLLADLGRCAELDVIFLDPLYQAVFGELSKEIPAKCIIRFLDRFKDLYPKASCILNHHHKKPSYSKEGKEVLEDDPFFGSQWLKAYVDTAYSLVNTGGNKKDRVTLYVKKDREEACLKELLLHYDPTTDTVTLDVPFEERSAYERARVMLHDLFLRGETTDFQTVREAIRASTRQTRSIQQRLIAHGLLRCDKSLNNKKIWEPQQG